MKLLWLPRAIEDFNNQINHIANDNLRTAAEQGDRIINQSAQLLIYPEMGRLGRVEGTRELVIGRTPFILIYRAMKGHIELIRLLHGSQKFP